MSYPSYDKRSISKSDCPHVNWIIYGNNLIGMGTCLDCNMEVNLSELINNTIHRLKKLEQSLIILIEKLGDNNDKL